MKLKKWLKYIDTSNLNCNIYLKYEKTDDTFDYDLIYAGSMYSIPYWLVDYNIEEPDKDGEPISYTNWLKKNVDDDEPTKGYGGFCIYLEERPNDRNRKRIS